MSHTSHPSAIFIFTCPHDTVPVQVEITPEQVNAVPLVRVTSVQCPTCYRDITEPVRLALNAPTLFVRDVLDSIAVNEEPDPLEGKRLLSPTAFQRFLTTWWAVRDIVERAEYLTEEERSIVQDRYGFRTGKPLSYAALGRQYHRSARGILDVLRRVYGKVMVHSAEVILSFIPQPSARGAEQDSGPPTPRIVNTPVLLSIAEAAALLGLSRWRVYQAGRFDKVADPVADEPKGGWLVFACPLAQRPKLERRKNSDHGTFFVTRDSLQRYRDANRPPGPKGVNTRAWLERVMRGRSADRRNG